MIAFNARFARIAGSETYAARLARVEIRRHACGSGLYYIVSLSQRGEGRGHDPRDGCMILNSAMDFQWISEWSALRMRDIHRANIASAEG